MNRQYAEGGGGREGIFAYANYCIGECGIIASGFKFSKKSALIARPLTRNSITEI